MLCGKDSEKVCPVEKRNDAPLCHDMPMTRILTAPMAFVRQSVHYTSPVDGRPITSYQEHLEELARTDSVVYEPGIKQDQERNERRREDALEQAVDETVDREISTMPASKREKLAAELEGGISAEPVNISAPYKPIVTELEK